MTSSYTAPVGEKTHPAGPTFLVWTNDRHVYSGGADGTIHKDGTSHFEVEKGKEQIACITASPDGKYLFVGSQQDGADANLRHYDAFEGVTVGGFGLIGPNTGLGMRDVSYVAPWCCAAYDAEGVFSVKIHEDILEMVNKSNTSAHEGGVKGVALDPKLEYLVSTGADGFLNVYRFVQSDGQDELLTHLNLIPRAMADEDRSSAKAMFKPRWDPAGDRFALGGASRGRIYVFTRGKWNSPSDAMLLMPDLDLLSERDHTTLVAWSQRDGGKYLAAHVCGDKIKAVCIWDMSVSPAMLVQVTPFKVGLTDLCFCPYEPQSGLDELAAASESGEVFRFILDPKPVVVAGVKSSSTATTTTIHDHEDAVTHEQQQPVRNDDDDDAPSITTVPAPPPPTTTTVTVRLPPPTTNDAVMDDSIDKIKRDLMGTKPSKNGGDGGDSEIDGKTFTQHRRIEDDPAFAELTSQVQGMDHSVLSLQKALEPHPPFQPGATRDEEGGGGGTEMGSRYLAWNSVGFLVLSLESGTHTIKITFADDSAGPRGSSRRIMSEHPVDLGSMCSLGVLYASRGRVSSSRHHDDDQEDQEVDNDDEEDEGNTRNLATVTWNQFEHWSSDVEAANWNFTLAKGETIVTLGCSSEICAIATNRNMLRAIRSRGGVQELPIMLPGSPISLVVSGGLVLVIHAWGAGITAGPATGFILYNFGLDMERFPGPKLVCCGHLPPCDRWVWCGFSDESMGFMPLLMNKSGHLFGLSAAANWSWVPLLDTRSVARASRLWPIAVNATSGLIAVQMRLNGGRKFPPVIPNPVPVNFPLRAPLLGLPMDANKKDGASLKYIHELDVAQNGLIVAQRRWIEDNVVKAPDGEHELLRAEAQADVVALKHFMFCIKTGKLPRGLAVAKKLRLDKSLDVALRKAQDMDADRTLQNQLIELIDSRQGMMMTDVDGMMPQVQSVNTHGNSKKRLYDNMDDQGDYNQQNHHHHQDDEEMAQETSVPVTVLPPPPPPPQRPRNPFLKTSSPAGKKRAGDDLTSTFSSSPIREPQLKKLPIGQMELVRRKI